MNHREFLEMQHHTKHLPDEMREKLYHLAYERERSGGMTAVSGEYEKLAGFVIAAYSAGYHAGRRAGT